MLGEYDIILGMGFSMHQFFFNCRSNVLIRPLITVRNAYTLFDYGDWVNESSNDRDDPYIQLLPTTNKTSAHNDFVQVRLNGVDTTGSASQALLPADQGQKSPISEAEKKKMYVTIVAVIEPSIKSTMNRD